MSARLCYGLFIVLGCVVCVRPVLADRQEQPRYVVLRRVDNGVLHYEGMTLQQFEERKRAGLEQYEKAHQAWRETRQGKPPVKPRFIKIPGTFKSKEQADAAGRSHADRYGYFTCWRCNGSGEHMRQTVGRPFPCYVCKGAKRIKSAGYVIVRITVGQARQYSYALTRPRRAELIHREAGLGQAGGFGGPSKALSTRKIRAFRAGQLDVAKQNYEKLLKSSTKDLNFVPPTQLDASVDSYLKVRWPDTFYERVR